MNDRLADEYRSVSKGSYAFPQASLLGRIQMRIKKIETIVH